MEKNNYSFDDVYSKLVTLDTTPKEISYLVEYVVEKIPDHLLRKYLTKKEVSCLKFLLNLAANIPLLFEERHERMRQVKTANEITSKRNLKLKDYKNALEALGVKKDKIKSDAEKKMKFFYELYMSNPGNKKNGGWEITGAYNENEFKISWSSKKEKQFAIIDLIKRYFYPSSRNAIIKRLRELGAKEVPAQIGSGKVHYYKKTK